MAEGQKVTLLSEPLAEARTPGAERQTGSRASVALNRRRAGDAAVAAALLWWAIPLTRATGGRSPGNEAGLLVLIALAAVLVRPWRTLPRTAVVVPVLLSVAALAVPAVAPTGWRGADDAAGYVCAAMAFVVAAGWACTPFKRLLLAAGMVLAGLDQVVTALLPWWGGGDPSISLSGSFGWHNPFAAFLMPAAVLGLALVVWRSRPVHLAGWVAAPLCSAGVVFSTSRATLAVLVAAWLGCGVLALRGSDRRNTVRRWAALSAVTVGLIYLLPGQPLFAHRVSPFAASEARTAGGETLAANGGYRLEFWKSALRNLQHHPLVGTGYHGLVEASEPLTPGNWARSNYAHNGYLQAFSDGGVLLGLPLLIATVLLAGVAIRMLWRTVRTGTVEPLPAAAALALLASLAHSAVDFDWSHSALFVMDALAAAMVVAGRENRPHRLPAPRSSRTAAVLVIGLAVLGGGLGWVGSRNAGAAGSSMLTGQALAARWTRLAARPLSSDAAGRSLLAFAVEHPMSVTDVQLHVALSNTAREATVDLLLAELRAEAQVRLGETGSTNGVLRRLEAVEAHRPAFAAELGPLLAVLGHQQQALDILGPPAEDAIRTHLQVAISAFEEAYARVAGAGSRQATCLRSEIAHQGSCNPDELSTP